MKAARNVIPESAPLCEWKIALMNMVKIPAKKTMTNAKAIRKRLADGRSIARS
jgi:hypothetical protein